MTSANERRPIVLGVETPDPSAMAVAWAADEAERRHVPLRLVHAVPSVLHEHRPFEQGRYQQALRERGAEALEKAEVTARTRHPGLETSTALGEGTASHLLCRESAHAELVVLGSRRLSRVEEVLSVGSVTVPVSAQAHCPVVVVGAPEHITQDPPYLVVGVDGSPWSAAAVEHAYRAAALRNAELRAIWVWQPPFLALAAEEFSLREGRRLLHESTAGFSVTYPDVRATHEVLVGHPVEELAKASEHALAVVVGRRGQGGFTGLRLGPVPHGLLHRAACPVVTVPSRR
ncbi:universal stress protein [Kitasatospora sp. CMC57]|uniref:Universal stress protein n=1 Tax=Kitasatospora sp. CMC57 TaxID=3231513 RepID=A0AB33K3L8_9ACTN